MQQEDGAAVEQGGAGGGHLPWTLLHNTLIQIQKLSDRHRDMFKLSVGELTFHQKQGVVDNPSRIVVKGEVHFLQRTFFSGWQLNQQEVKHDLASQILEYVNNLTFDGAVLGVIGRVQGTSHCTLQSHPGQFWWQEELARAGLGMKRKKKKSVAARERRRKVLKNKFPSYFRNVFWSCGGCKSLNYSKYDSCHNCKKGKEQEKKLPEETYIAALDMERTGRGQVEATPISIGLATISLGGEVANEQEIFILPDEGEWEDPHRNSWITKNKHRMYIERRGGVRQLFKLGEREPLPAVTEQEGVRILLEYVRSNKISKVLYHGEDHKSLRPFIRKQGEEIEFKMHDTRRLFVDLERARLGLFGDTTPKHRMEFIVEQYGSPAVKERYIKGAHSALVDASSLASLLVSERLVTDFELWLENQLFSL